MKRLFAVQFPAAVALVFSLTGAAASQTASTVTVRLDRALSTESSEAGDRFTATLAERLVSNGRVVAERDARVTGHVQQVVSSGRLQRPAEITLRLDRVEPGGRSYPIGTGALTIKQSSHAARNLVIIGGSAGAGAAIGGAAAGGKGAAVGAAVGAGAGTLTAFLTGKREIVVPAETLLTFQVNSVTISAKELAELQRVDSADRGDFGRDRDSYPVVERRRGERDDDDEDRDDDDAYERRRDDDRDPVLIFSRDERVIILDFFRGYRSNLPPGLAKRDRLPPGLEKQLRERGTLPPGLQKRVEPLPWELEHRLHRLPGGYRRVMIGGSVIVMNERTSVVYAILRDVIQ